MPSERGGADTLSIRRARVEDEQQILNLMTVALGWRPGDANDALFRWKHDANPFGASPTWVATDGDRLVGLRTFMRWQFTHAGRTLQAVRAVDTATHPDYQGRGIFTRLTLHALDELRAEGVDFVFNTPNDQSRPGYLKMGWVDLGRLPIGLVPYGPAGLLSALRSRVPADLWSLPTSAGLPAGEVLADGAAAVSLSSFDDDGLHTARTADYLRWRYGLPELHYRAVLAGASIEDGVTLFRLRRRGPSVEAAIGDVLMPRRNRWGTAALIRRVLRETRASYAVTSRAPTVTRGAVLPVPRQGPILVRRAVCEELGPPPRAWRLSLGDVELF